ncbi:ClpP family protease [Corynebacterium freneyi]
MSSYTIPTVITRTPEGERAIDIFSRLLEDRIVYLGTGIDDSVANSVIAQLLHLENDNAERPISMYVNSVGGDLSSILAIYDTMQLVRAPVETTCVGQVVAGSAILLAGGAPGKRAMLPHGRVVVHPPVVEGGRATIPDLIIEADEIERTRHQIDSILARHTGKPLAEIRLDTERKLVLDARAAVDYGMADKIVGEE